MITPEIYIDNLDMSNISSVSTTPSKTPYNPKDPRTWPCLTRPNKDTTTGEYEPQPQKNLAYSTDLMQFFASTYEKDPCISGRSVGWMNMKFRHWPFNFTQTGELRNVVEMSTDDFVFWMKSVNGKDWAKRFPPCEETSQDDDFELEDSDDSELKDEHASPSPNNQTSSPTSSTRILLGETHKSLNPKEDARLFADERFAALKKKLNDTKNELEEVHRRCVFLVEESVRFDEWAGRVIVDRDGARAEVAELERQIEEMKRAQNAQKVEDEHPVLQAAQILQDMLMAPIARVQDVHQEPTRKRGAGVFDELFDKANQSRKRAQLSPDDEMETA